SYIAYGVDDPQAGGVVLINVTVTAQGGANHGLMVESGATGTNGSVEIGTVNLTAAGRPFVFTAPVDATVSGVPGIAVAPRNDTLVGQSAPSNLTPLDIVLKGPSTVDVFSITAP